MMSTLAATICVSCCDAPATTTSDEWLDEEAGHPVCESCRYEDSRRIYLYEALKENRNQILIDLMLIEDEIDALYR